MNNKDENNSGVLFKNTDQWTIIQQGKLRVIFGGFKTKTNVSGLEVPDKNNAIMIPVLSYQPSDSE